MEENFLIVAFDGLDYELIKEFDLENITQSEFGKIDNHTGIDKILTGILFASFITGELPEVHGADKKGKYNSKLGLMLDRTITSDITSKIRGMTKLKNAAECLIGKDVVMYRKEHLNSKTIFEKIEGSRAITVPSYNPSKFSQAGLVGRLLELGYSSAECLEYRDEIEFEYRKRKFFRELENEIVSPRPLLMAHFHKSDKHQHHYGDKTLDNFDKTKLRSLYLEIDELAGKIKKKAKKAGYDNIIFMSDHGLPRGFEHNKNAFYSSNKEIFSDKKPHITDFYDKIVQDVN